MALQTRQPGGSTRDPAIDQLRGYAVVAMVATHAAGSTPLYRLAHPTGPMSAASLFLLLAGMVLGSQVARRRNDGRLDDLRPALVRRAAWLWMVHVALFALFFVVDRTVAPMDVLADLPQPAWLGVVEVAALWWRPTYFDILPLYVFLLLGMVAIVEAIKRGGLWLVLLVSTVAYGLGQLQGARVQGFGLASWQVLFVLGALGGLYRERLEAARWWLVPAAALVLLATAIVASRATPGIDRWLFQRATLGPGRLLHAVALVLVALPALSWLARWPWGARLLAPLGTMGRHSLLAFCVHLVALMPLIASGAHRWPVMDQMIAASAVVVVVYAATAIADHRPVAKPQPRAA